MPITRARLKISDYNENRKSKVRSQERRVRSVSLSLTSMVDMFAILVIFLLANTNSFVEWLQVSHGINLPRAKSTDVPEKAASIQIAKDGIYAEEKQLLSMSQARQNLEPLKKYLAQVEKKKGYINIVADTKLPFGLIKKVIGTCQDSGFSNVNLAVQPRG